jgi:hypothetical protein
MRLKTKKAGFAHQFSLTESWKHIEFLSSREQFYQNELIEPIGGLSLPGAK